MIVREVCPALQFCWKGNWISDTDDYSILYYKFFDSIISIRSIGRVSLNNSSHYAAFILKAAFASIQSAMVGSNDSWVNYSR